METQKFEIDTAQSNIDWVGRKVTGAHHGTIAIKAGSLTLADGKVTAGKFIIDTTSINILDITDAATNNQFAGHLASEDFFGIEKYPEATFEITSIAGSHITGDLTIKGITHPVDFDAAITTGVDTIRASAEMIVDRTKYEMKFRSGNFFTSLGDTLIYNDFDLDVQLTAVAIF